LGETIKSWKATAVESRKFVKLAVRDFDLRDSPF